MYIQINIRILNKLIKHWGLDKNNEMTVCPVISLFKGWTVITELFGVMDHEFFSGYFYHRVVTVRINNTYIYLPALFYLLHNNIIKHQTQTSQRQSVSQEAELLSGHQLDRSVAFLRHALSLSYAEYLCIYYPPSHLNGPHTVPCFWGFIFSVRWRSDIRMTALVSRGQPAWQQTWHWSQTRL